MTRPRSGDLADAITRERAERIARAHACEHCQEYSYKKLTVKPASDAHRAEFNELWHVIAICGICGLHQEMGIDDDGDIVYVG
jgi:transcription elongation factor Elf1